MTKMITQQRHNLNLSLQLSHALVNDILDSQEFFVEYQPIISPYTDEIYAYEALSRFRYNELLLAPKEVFEYCHKDKDLFYKLEMQTKQLQFQERPQDTTLFINFDPHIFYKKEKTNEIFAFLASQKDFVIELVENSHQGVNIELLIEIFRKLDHKFAIDDFFQDNTELSLFLLNNCNYLKLDRGILEELKMRPHFHYIIEGLVSFAHHTNIKVILEGIETRNDLEIAKRYKVDFVQGFYYKKLFLKSHNL